MNKQLWKNLSSNARAAIREKRSTPQRIYPYVGLSHVGILCSKEYQAYLNECACFVLEFYGGVWLDSPDQGFPSREETRLEELAELIMSC